MPVLSCVWPMMMRWSQSPPMFDVLTDDPKRKDVRQAQQAIRSMARETAARAPLHDPPCDPASSSQTRRPGPWRVLEVFIWAMTVSFAAAAAGWEVGEPVTLRQFDILNAKDRQLASSYIHDFDPDLLVVAWPCTVWSPLQLLGRKTSEQLQRLAQRRAEQRPLLQWVCDEVLARRRPGGVTLGENPGHTKTWMEPAIVQAFEGLPKALKDMCQFGLRCPRDEFAPGLPPLFLNKHPSHGR